MRARNTRQKLFKDDAPVLSALKQDDESVEAEEYAPEVKVADHESQDSPDESTPKAKCPAKRRRTFGQKLSKRQKNKIALARRVENSRAFESLNVSVGDEIILHSRVPNEESIRRFGDFEFSSAKFQFSKLHHELCGCTPIGVWTVVSIEDDIFNLQLMHTTTRNPEYQHCHEVWPKVLENRYLLGQTGCIGAYDLLHRLMDKTALHVRTKTNPLSKYPNLQRIGLKVLVQNEQIMLANRKHLPIHLLDEFNLCRKEVDPIAVEFRIAHVAFDQRKSTPLKVVPGEPDWTDSTWTILPETASYERIWIHCARALLHTNPQVPGCYTGLALEPEGGTAACMDAYLAACRRGDTKFEMTFPAVWEIRKKDPPYRGHGGCIGGGNLVLVRPPAGAPAAAPGAPPPAVKRVRDVRAGDVIACEGGFSAVVAAWGIPAGAACPMVRLRGVWLTPDHPVLDPAAGRWCRADALAPTVVPRDIDCVYNLAVATRAGVLVAPAPDEAAGGAAAGEAVVCCTLGQPVPGMPDAVWGSEVILDWMRTQPGWPNLHARAPLLGGPDAAATAAAAHRPAGPGETALSAVDGAGGGRWRGAPAAAVAHG